MSSKKSSPAGSILLDDVTKITPVDGKEGQAIWNYDEVIYELQKRLDVINDFHAGKLTAKEALDKINRMVEDYIKEHPDTTEAKE